MLGHGVEIGRDTTVEQAVIMQGAKIGATCTLRAGVVGPNARIGDHCTIDGTSVICAGVTLGAGNHVSNGARLFPGISLPDGALLF